MKLAVLVIGLVAAGVVYGPATPAQAETCAEHLAKHPGTTSAMDIAGHASGQYPGESPCKGDSDRIDNSRSDDYNKDYHRSRWEDKTSFDCGWSWLGGFGC